MQVTAITQQAVTRAVAAAPAKSTPTPQKAAPAQTAPAKNYFANAPRPRIMPFRLPENNVDVRQFLSMTATTLSTMQSNASQLDVTV